MDAFPARKYSKSQIKSLMRDGNKLTRIHDTDLAEYKLIRALAVEDGLLAAPSYFVPETDALPDRNAPKVFSDEQLLARGTYSIARCTELLRGTGLPSTDNLMNLQKNSPEAFRLFRVACKSYGLISPNVQIAPAPVAVEVVDQSVAVGAEIEANLNLPEGYRVENQERLTALIGVHRKVLEMKAAKLEGERTAAAAAAFGEKVA
jgi:hypothetical protein